MQKYVLDSSALISFLRAETGGEKVKKLLFKAGIPEIIILMHNASIAEVYYDSLYYYSQQNAEIILKTFPSYPINFIEIISTELIKLIGYFKTSYKVSFADCFVLATAKLDNAKVVTSS